MGFRIEWVQDDADVAALATIGITQGIGKQDIAGDSGNITGMGAVGVVEEDKADFTVAGEGDGFGGFDVEKGGVDLWVLPEPVGTDIYPNRFR